MAAVKKKKKERREVTSNISVYTHRFATFKLYSSYDHLPCAVSHKEISSHCDTGHKSIIKYVFSFWDSLWTVRETETPT